MEGANGPDLPFGFTWDLVRRNSHLDLVWSTSLDCSAWGQAILNGQTIANGLDGACPSNLPHDANSLIIPADFDTNHTGGKGDFSPSNFSPIIVTPPEQPGRRLQCPEPGSLVLVSSLLMESLLIHFFRRLRSRAHAH